MAKFFCYSPPKVKDVPQPMVRLLANLPDDHFIFWTFRLALPLTSTLRSPTTCRVSAQDPNRDGLFADLAKRNWDNLEETRDLHLEGRRDAADREPPRPN
jgi:hypothetical protein